MNEQKLTDWFSPDTRPECEGVYEKEPPEGDSVEWFQYWDGERWWYGEDTPEGAVESFETGPLNIEPTPRRWRRPAMQP